MIAIAFTDILNLLPYGRSEDDRLFHEKIQNTLRPTLQENYNVCPGEAIRDCIEEVLESHGFTRHKPLALSNIYFGDNTTDEVKAIIAVQDLQRQHPWFVECVQDIRMLRIEAQSDLKPALNFIKNS